MLIKKNLNKMLLFFTGCFFFFFDKLSSKEKDCVVIFMRNGQPDSDTVPLLEFIDCSVSPRLVCLVTSKPDVTSQYVRFFKVVAPRLEMKVVTRKRRFRFLLRSSYVFIKNGLSDAPELRYQTNGARKVIFIDHGLVTKLPTKYKAVEVNSPMLSVDGGKFFGWRVAQGRLHASSMLAMLRKLDPSHVLPIGYPRFYRARQLLRKEAAPIVDEILSDNLQDFGGVRILWAPTHPPKPNKPKFLPFEDYTKESFEDFCDKNNIKFFVKAHAVNDEIDFVGGKPSCVEPISSNQAPGALELLPYFDVVVTDWSSIMMEAVALDIPVIHAVPKGVLLPLRFEESVSLPGKVANNSEGLFSCVLEVLKNPPDNSCARNYWNLDRNDNMSSVYMSNIPD